MQGIVHFSWSGECVRMPCFGHAAQELLFLVHFGLTLFKLFIYFLILVFLCLYLFGEFLYLAGALFNFKLEILIILLKPVYFLSQFEDLVVLLVQILE